MRIFVFSLLVLLANVIDGRFFQCDVNRSCGCGPKNVEINARVISGEEAVPYSWPMIVSIRYDLFHDGNFLRHACGGTVLTDSYILTTASCLEEFISRIESANVTIAAGMHRRSQPVQIVRHVDQIIVHPNWTSAQSNDYDIALLHLSDPLNIGMYLFITRTCLPAQLHPSEDPDEYHLTGATLAVVGWGRSTLFGYDSDPLRQTVITSTNVNNAKCANHTMNSRRQFCTASHSDSTGQRLLTFVLFLYSNWIAVSRSVLR